VLDVASNMIDSLPDELRFLYQLTTLDISNNDLNILPAWLGFMTLLTRLVVDGNPLRTMKKSLIGGGGGVPALKAYLKTRATPDEAILFEKEVTAVQAAKHHIGLAPPSAPTAIIHKSGEPPPQLQMAAAAAAANNLTESLTLAWSLAVREAMSTPSLKLIVSPSTFPIKLTSFSLSELSRGAQREALQRYRALVVDGHAIVPEGIPKDLLAVCANVSEVSLSRNSLERVPDALTYTAAAAAATALGRAASSLNLRTLRLSFNLIPTNGVPWLPSSLLTLDLSHNRLKRIPKCLTLRGLPHLESLSLSNNDIEAPAEDDLGDEGSGDALLWLPKLRSLNLSGNVLTRIPVAVLGLKHLSDLDISKNDISSLQPHIGCILSLTHLNIEGNPQRGVRPGVVEMGTPACLGFLRSRVAVGDEKKYVSMFAVEEEEIIAPQPVNSAHAQQQQFYQQKPESITSQVMTMKQQHPVAHSSTSSSAGMTGDYYQMVRRIEELQNELQSGGGSVAQIQASKRELLLLRAAEARAKQQNSGF
jgi:Leucine-rich repeat (LRR) protein